MRCENPLTLKVNGILHTVGCGHCVACKIQRSREWSFRLNCEARYWSTACFLTLTYNDDNLPEDLSIHKEDLQKFFKRLRKDLDKPIKHYSCGEYGEKGGLVKSGINKGKFIHRAHYHSIVFGLSPKDKDLVQSNWNLGFVYCGSVTSDSIDYVTSYVQKKLYFKNAYPDKESPFSLMSKGLGLRYALDNKDSISKQDYLRYKGKPISIPRYFFKKLELEKTNPYIRLNPIADQLGYDSKYFSCSNYTHGLLNYAVYNDRRVLGSLHQLNLRLSHILRSKL